jgi:hypothetical protein
MGYMPTTQSWQGVSSGSQRPQMKRDIPLLSLRSFWPKPTMAKKVSIGPGFFDALYGDSTQNLHIVLWKRSNRQSQWIPLRALDGIVDKFLIGQSYPDLYFGVGLHSRLPETPETNRGGAASVAALSCLWFDLDVACGNHINTDLPTRAEATAFTDKLPFGLPSMVVDTGGGYHLYWLFREMWLLESPAEKQEASNLSYRFQQTIRELRLLNPITRL